MIGRLLQGVQIAVEGGQSLLGGLLNAADLVTQLIVTGIDLGHQLTLRPGLSLDQLADWTARRTRRPAPSASCSPSGRATR